MVAEGVPGCFRSHPGWRLATCYGHLYPEADAALRDRLDVLYGSAQPAPTSPVVRLPRQSGRGPSVAPGASGNDKSAADGTRTTL